MTSVSRSSSYRPEIQGLRTIGALLVACFHIWGGRVSGGVDVFFVVSGFLITGSLYREVETSRTIDVVAFWGRIARRIAPLAYLVLALTLLAALFWLPRTRQDGFLSEVLYSAFHLENIKLMMNSVDYLAREEAPSPVQQFWALSVQVQFYAVWPFLLLAAAFLARRLRAAWGVHLAVLAGVFLASLTYSVIETHRDPSPAYFNTLARVWEFALGGILAVALPRLALPSGLRLTAGWIGLLAVVGCGFVIPASAAYPGYVALWPTLGAALVLIGGGSGRRLGADRLLAAKPLVALGEISFSFYLWHWPVLIFTMIVTGRTELGVLPGLLVIAMALCGAYGANRWIEQPIQRSSFGRNKAWHLHAMATGFAVPVLAVAVIWYAFLGFAEGNQNQGLSRSEYPGGSIPASSENALRAGIPLQPEPAVAKRDIARVYGDKCHQTQRKAEVIACPYGNERAPTKTIALVGGSHSAHWLAALEALAQQHGWRIVSITKSACPFELNHARKAPCVQWNENVIEYLASLKPDVVFTTSTRPFRRASTHPQGSRNGSPIREEVPEGYLRQWERLDESGVSVIAIRDNPWLGADVPECVEKNAANVLDCGRPRDRVMDRVDPASQLRSKPRNVEFIDLTDRFCDQSRCFPVNGNVIIYSDSHHITTTYSRSLAPVLGERMRQVRPDLFVHSSGS
ncbi:acyltransferase family protein [Microvirga lenta]|uniref:acyltransferase family protein n=1 Tax=Microvirga lenta TaxID=2881337 RepID=UPI001CFFEDE0|nr:acyltransferase family protein [Microvirga lenta]MCB5175324.1 acyltransferase [Microvirga lenta]